MKKRIADLMTNRKVAGSIVAVALAVVIGGVSLWQSHTEIPELPEYTDPIMEVSIEDEEPPLADKPKTTSKTTTKTTKKNVTMSTAATKTYTKKLPVTSKTTTKTLTSSTQTVKTDTTVKTAVTEKYTKKSKVKVVTTKVTTTVKTTTTPLKSSTTVTASAKTGKYEVNVAALAPKMDKRVLSAYQTMGFKVYVDSSVSYAGYFNARDRSITLREESENVYHELGHFLAFISGNTDQTSAFKAIYSQEMAKYSGYNAAYVTQNSAEYFAESTRDYILNGAALKSARPNTYAALEAALNKVTDAQVSKLMKMYASVWK